MGTHIASQSSLQDIAITPGPSPSMVRVQDMKSEMSGLFEEKRRENTENDNEEPIETFGIYIK